MPDFAWKDDWLPIVQRFAAAPALTDERGTLTYEALFDLVGGVVSCVLQNGLAPGDTVAILAPNGRAVAAGSLGVTISGCAEACINPALSESEIRHCLNVSGTRLVLTTAERLGWVGSLGIKALDIDAIAPAPFAGIPRCSAPSGAASRITFTSGTTGKPKGIVHDQDARWTHQALMRSTLPIVPRPGRAILLMTPFSHGASLLTYAFLQGGAEVVLLSGVREDPVRGAVAGGRVDQIFAPPTVLRKLVSLFEGETIRSIDCIFCGTAPLSPELYRAARAIFGPVVRVTYGKSEIFNPITVLSPDDVDAWIGEPHDVEGAACVGWPAPGVEVLIADDPGEPRRAGPVRIGPVMLRARHMLCATLTEAGRTEHPADAFHHTGDLGFLDSRGRLNLVGREADVMKTGGYKVTPDEVEGHLLSAVPGGEIVVLGLPSAYWGEVITLVATGVGEDWETNLTEPLSQMTQYKRPRLFAVLPELPRNGQGKIVRARVREAVLEAYELVDGARPQLVRHGS